MRRKVSLALVRLKFAKTAQISGPDDVSRNIAKRRGQYNRVRGSNNHIQAPTCNAVPLNLNISLHKSCITRR